jgi:hypothetical protein
MASEEEYSQGVGTMPFQIRPPTKNGYGFILARKGPVIRHLAAAINERSRNACASAHYRFIKFQQRDIDIGFQPFVTVPSLAGCSSVKTTFASLLALS